VIAKELVLSRFARFEFSHRPLDLLHRFVAFAQELFWFSVTPTVQQKDRKTLLSDFFGGFASLCES